MSNQYSLVQKSKHFTLVHARVKNKEFWQVSLTPTARVWLGRDEILEISNFFSSNVLVIPIGLYVWRLDIEDSAYAMYNWANIKWSGHANEL